MRSKNKSDCLKWVLRVAKSATTRAQCRCALNLIGNFILQFDVNIVDDTELDMLLTSKCFKLKKYARTLSA